MPPVGTLEILVILIALLLFGPKRIPEIARTVGSALNELRRTSDGFVRELTKDVERSRQGPVEPDVKDQVSQPQQPAESEPKPLSSEQIREAARSLGLEVEGKTDEQLKAEIASRMYSDKGDPYGLSEAKAG